jgi:hypothetical protein
MGEHLRSDGAGYTTQIAEYALVVEGKFAAVERRRTVSSGAACSSHLSRWSVAEPLGRRRWYRSDNFSVMWVIPDLAPGFSECLINRGLAGSAWSWRSGKMQSAGTMILICDDQEKHGARAYPAYAAAPARPAVSL